MLSGNIINVTRYCVDDGPGIRTSVFLKGCPLRCVWCHNPESQKAETERSLNGRVFGKTVTSEEVFREIKKDVVFYEKTGGGATITGGEPLAQPGFTAEILDLCRKNGINTAIETSGFAKEDVFLDVVSRADLVLFDIKETDRARHIEYTGVSPDLIMNNLEKLESTGIPFIIRLPIIPGYNDREDHFESVAGIIAGFSNCAGYEIMPYHSLGKHKYEELGRDYICSNVIEPAADIKIKWKNELDDMIKRKK
ncbi:MAG: glycyl-radical enzyme activating protein [Clostridia bacterium]|nr:glycyl-radical enzyme activating protein [Clostridia bacterium]